VWRRFPDRRDSLGALSPKTQLYFSDFLFSQLSSEKRPPRRALHEECAALTRSLDQPAVQVKIVPAPQSPRFASLSEFVRADLLTAPHALASGNSPVESSENNRSVPSPYKRVRPFSLSSQLQSFSPPARPVQPFSSPLVSRRWLPDSFRLESSPRLRVAPFPFFPSSFRFIG